MLHHSSLSKLHTAYFIHNHSLLLFIRQDILLQYSGNSSRLNIDGRISLNPHTAKQVQDPSQIPDSKTEYGNNTGNKNDWSHYSHKKGVRKSMGTLRYESAFILNYLSMQAFVYQCSNLILINFHINLSMYIL